MKDQQHVKPEVAKEWLAKKVQEDPNRVIGRVLLAIYKNQTDDEKVNNGTYRNNGVGFAKPDARVGSIGARMYHYKGKLEQWVIDLWMRPARNGYPRVCKYSDQLNVIAKAKYERIMERAKTDNPNKQLTFI